MCGHGHDWLRIGKGDSASGVSSITCFLLHKHLLPGSPGTLQPGACLRCSLDLLHQEMIDEADRDNDGEVNLEEFERIMRVRSQQSPSASCFHLDIKE